MLWLVLATVLGLALMLVIARKFIPYLHKMKFGQTIYELGPQSHKAKQGTPTMGGLMFAAVTFVLSIILILLSNGFQGGLWNFGIGLLLASLLNMAVGFVDDYIKVIKKRNLGLIWWQKIIGQVVASLAFSVYCYLNPYVGSKILIPFTSLEWDLGLFYIPVMCCFLIFTVNSSNLQDGLDGLLSSTAVIGSSTFGIIALMAGIAVGAESTLLPQYRSLCIFAFALAGALIGFLRYNYYPAKVFMGDTGSMFIGGAITGMSMLMRMPLLAILVCVTWLASSFSVIMQRAYFKITHGKRIFKMSPIHHHFELCGMSECQIVAMYSAVELFACLLAVCGTL